MGQNAVLCIARFPVFCSPHELSPGVSEAMTPFTLAKKLCQEEFCFSLLNKLYYLANKIFVE